MPLEQMLAFDAIITVEGHQHYAKLKTTFYVIKDGSQPLLGKKTAEQLGILKIKIPTGTVVAINEIKIKKAFPKIKGIIVHLPVKENVRPVQTPLRRLPIALSETVRLKLNELEDQDIIEKVDEPSKWISALVPVFKDSGEIRLCVDMRRLNEVIERKHHPIPIFDDILPMLKEAKYFSVLDVKQAYHQLELDEESKELTTFMTQWGRYRYKRLLFGVSCAPEIFQKTMEMILSGCANVVIYVDDILIFGSTEKEHDKCCKMVMDTLEVYNVLLNTQKCKIKVTKVTFLGHILSQDGIQPKEDKIDAIRRFRAPITKEEIRSFLGQY